MSSVTLWSGVRSVGVSLASLQILCAICTLREANYRMTDYDRAEYGCFFPAFSFVVTDDLFL
ncbi:MAG TPA: hypothetical protein V6D30_05610 [Leptolyngbyaceae cyanobacterium]